MMNTTSSTLQRTLKAHVDFFTAHAEQFRLLPSLLRLIARGKPVAPEELASSSHYALNEIQAWLHSSDAQLDQAGHLIGYGLSLLPTPHQFHLGEQALYAWCAFDTLIFPPLLKRSARVISTCPVTGTEIRLTVTPEAIVDLSTASAALSIRLPGEDTNACNLQEDICNAGFFFASRDVASTQGFLHQGAVLLSVEEAAQVAREFARHILAL